MSDPQKIQLSEKFVQQLMNTPETGMGFHQVDIYLNNGIVLRNKIVLNCSILILEDSIKIDPNEIEEIIVNESI
ncbi:MAG: hypothetical protein H6Q25_809 [Bacteroidetes bacterium]|nr:hypothetical protein [Bacteroidota bacterium]